MAPVKYETDHISIHLTYRHCFHCPVHRLMVYSLVFAGCVYGLVSVPFWLLILRKGLM